MSYIKTFMEDYLRQEKEIYKPIPIKYLIYNSQTRQFRSSNISSSKQQCEYVVQVLNNNSVIPSFIYQITTSIIVLIASYIIFNQYLDISNRDNINWDNYSWYFNKSDAPEPGESNDEDIDEGDEDDAEDVCVGSACCAYDYVYDSTLNQCVPPEEASS